MNIDLRVENEARSNGGNRKSPMSFLPLGTSSITKNREKKDLVIGYLVKFGYSTKSVICDFLEVNETGQSSFFKKMIDADIIYKYHPRWIAKKSDYIFALTSKGLHQARKIYGADFEYFIDVKKIKYLKFDHDLTCQLVFNKLMREDYYLREIPVDTNFLFNSIITEKEYRRKYDIKDLSKTPDFIWKSFSGIDTAIEVEISEKSNKRKYESYERIFNDINKQRYDQTRVE